MAGVQRSLPVVPLPLPLPVVRLRLQLDDIPAVTVGLVHRLGDVGCDPVHIRMRIFCHVDVPDALNWRRYAALARRIRPHWG
jgi:hypothetical protein